MIYLMSIGHHSKETGFPGHLRKEVVVFQKENRHHEEKTVKIHLHVKRKS